MKPFAPFEGTVAVLLRDNIDTDQIIPARFLKTISKEGLGEHLFHDWRYDAGGRPAPDFALNQPAASGAAIVLAGDNFGCGSSREHAPWALLDFGFRAVISTSFADIFRQNALKNGLLPIAISPGAHALLVDLLTRNPATTLAVHLQRQALILPDGSTVEFPIDEFAKHCLLHGIDDLDYVLQHHVDIARHEREHRAPINTREP
jgi:3-isopropylmalate/(R)-2-methylmalate dehydratase small subunit